MVPALGGFEAVVLIVAMTALPMLVLAVYFLLRARSGAAGARSDANLFMAFAMMTLYDAVVPSLEGVYLSVTGQPIAVPWAVTFTFLFLETLLLTGAVFFLMRVRHGHS